MVSRLLSIQTNSYRISKISTEAVVQEVSDWTIHYTVYQIVVHLSVPEILSISHFLLLEVAELFGLSGVVLNVHWNI